MASGNSYQISIRFLLLLTTVVATFCAGRFSAVRESHKQVRDANEARLHANAQRDVDARQRQRAETKVIQMQQLLIRANNTIHTESKRGDRLQQQLDEIREFQQLDEDIPQRSTETSQKHEF